MKKALSILSIGLLVWACSSNTEEQVQAKAETATESNPGASVAHVRKTSELTGLMLQMHDQLKAAKSYVEAGQPIPDSLKWDFEAIKTAQSTKPMGEKKNTFDGMATAFLTHLDKTINNPDIETYNQTVDACVTCHQSFCTGPIKKINKLKI